MQTLLTRLDEQPKNTYPADAFTLAPLSGSALHQNLLRYFYNTTIELRAKGIDQKVGIETVFFKTPDDRPCWWRKGEASTLMETNPADDSVMDVNFTRLFYAYLMAGIIIDLMQPQANEDCIQDIALLETHWKEGNLEATEAKSYLIELLALHHPHLNASAINSMLDETKNWVGMLAPAATLVTDITLPFGRCLIVETPCTQLTEAQQASFHTLNEQSWFKQHTPFTQQLITFFQPLLTDGQHVIPSQLRHIIPLNRNAYRTAVYAKRSDGAFKKVHQFFHCGTTAYLGKIDEAQAIQLTQRNLEQLAHTSHAAETTMICLNSVLADQVVGPFESWVKWNHYAYDDSRILQLTQSAATARWHYAKFCLNGFRFFEWNDYSGIDAIIEPMKKNFDLSENEHYQSMDEVLPQWTFFGDPEVKSLSILYHFTKLLFDYHKAIKKQAEPKPALSAWFGCASGENRTGIAIYDLLIETLTDFFVTPYDYSKLVARSQHIHFITGNQGNTFGTEGIRGKSLQSFKPTHQSNDLITLTADQKNLAATPPNPVHRQHFLLFKAQQRGSPTTPPAQTPLPF